MPGGTPWVKASLWAGVLQPSYSRAAALTHPGYARPVTRGTRVGVVG